jgi:hypothetical protein
MNEDVKFSDTGEAHLHPNTDCPYAGDCLVEITDGQEKYVYCEGCDKTWNVKELKTI